MWPTYWSDSRALGSPAPVGNRFARGGSDVAHWLEMHDAQTVTVDRKTAMGPIHVPRACVSITETIQPIALQKAMTDEFRANALLARLLFAQPPRRIPRLTEATVPLRLEKSMADLEHSQLLCSELQT